MEVFDDVEVRLGMNLKSRLIGALNAWHSRQHIDKATFTFALLEALPNPVVFTASPCDMSIALISPRPVKHK